MDMQRKEQEIEMKWNSQQKKNVIYSVGINYGIYLLLHLFFYAVYECPLDEMMQAALCGVSGTKTGNILYSHVLIGWILRGLFAVLPFVNWYFAYLSACVIAALSVICYVILRRTGNKIGLTVTVVLASFVGYECYILPGCMKTASVLGCAMLVVLADAAESGAIRRRGRKAIVVCLAVLCSMVQFSVFLLTVVIGFAGLGVYYAVCGSDEFLLWIKKQKENEMLRPLAVTGLCIFAAVALLQAADYGVYRFVGQENAARYRSAAVRMYGYGMGDYNADYQEKYGIDGAEYTAIRDGSFGVTGEAGWQKLIKLSKDGRKISGERINNFFKTVPLALFERGIFYLWIVMLFLLFFSPMEGRAKMRLVWTQTGLILFVFLTVYLCNAWQNNWNAFVLILPVLSPLLLALKDAKETEYQYLWVYLTVFSVILYSKFSSGMVSYVSEEKMSERFMALDGDKVNVIDLNAYFKSFSAQRIYTANILQIGNIRISNGAYALMEGFEDCVFSAYPDSDNYEWVYNPKQLSVGDLVFED